MPITENTLSKALCVSQEGLSQCLNFRNGRNDKEACHKIGYVIPDIECRKLVFPDTTPSGKKGVFAPKFLWLEPPNPLPRIPKLDKESAWSLWACCQTCGKNKFLPIIMNAEPHIACYYCIPPHQYRPIGATRVNRSLIHPALKKHY